MKSRILTILAIAFGTMVPASGVRAQDTMDRILRSIEENNASLKAAAAEMEVRKLENRSEALLEDLEVEFNYLWGQNAEVGQRHDLSVTQSFDIPTLLGMKARQATALDSQAALQYKAERLNILKEAQSLCIDAVYSNRIRAEYEVLLDYATRLYQATEREMEMGEVSALELNKARFNLTSARAQVERAELDAKETLSRLRVLNGGVDITLDSKDYGVSPLPEDFDTWFAQACEANPVLAYVAGEIALGSNGVRIDRLSALPRLTLGYMSEIGRNDKYRGITMGVAIPLWKNTNKVRQSQARVEVARERKAESEQEFYNSLRSEYDKAVSLKRLRDEYMLSLGEADIRDTLFKALDHGEISMGDYIAEINVLYQIIEEYLRVERDYMQSLAELNAVFL